MILILITGKRTMIGRQMVSGTSLMTKTGRTFSTRTSLIGSRINLPRSAPRIRSRAAIVEALMMMKVKMTRIAAVYSRLVLQPQMKKRRI